MTDPTEEEHYEAYKAVLTTIGPDRSVVIRTLDIGGDKFSAVSGMLANEKNPFLGVRSVRLCLRNLGMFKTQAAGHSPGQRPRASEDHVPDD